LMGVKERGFEVGIVDRGARVAGITYRYRIWGPVGYVSSSSTRPVAKLETGWKCRGSAPRVLTPISNGCDWRSAFDGFLFTRHILGLGDATGLVAITPFALGDGSLLSSLNGICAPMNPCTIVFLSLRHLECETRHRLTCHCTNIPFSQHQLHLLCIFGTSRPLVFMRHSARA
jgi:hypothetical protein